MYVIRQVTITFDQSNAIRIVSHPSIVKLALIKDIVNNHLYFV